MEKMRSQNKNKQTNQNTLITLGVQQFNSFITNKQGVFRFLDEACKILDLERAVLTKNQPFLWFCKGL